MTCTWQLSCAAWPKLSKPAAASKTFNASRDSNGCFMVEFSRGNFEILQLTAPDFAFHSLIKLNYEDIFSIVKWH